MSAAPILSHTPCKDGFWAAGKVEEGGQSHVAICSVCHKPASEHPAAQFEQRVERVNHPAHYGGGDNPYETIKVLEAWLTPEEFIGFCKGNAIKYQSRAGKHVANRTALEDVAKSRWYTNRMVEYMERKKNA